MTMETKVDKLLQIYKFTNELGENIIWTPTQKKIMSVILDLGIDNKHFIEIEVFSADGRNKQATGNAIMGFNAPFVILDEASLVNDAIEAKVFRMISGFSTTKHLYLKIGNT